jgi:hypothetical protein
MVCRVICISKEVHHSFKEINCPSRRKTTMEDVSEEESYPTTLRERLQQKQNEVKELKMKLETVKKTKSFRFPFKWNWKFNQAKKKVNADKALVLFFNKKNEIEAPKFMPIFSGNMIVWKNKVYEFDPRAIWTLRMKGFPRVYCIREIDRRPVINRYGQIVKTTDGKTIYGNAALSNLDIEQVRARGDSTESDEFLIKAALKAQTTQTQTKVNWIIIAVIVIAAIIGIVWLMKSKTLG